MLFGHGTTTVRLAYSPGLLPWLFYISGFTCCSRPSAHAWESALQLKLRVFQHMAERTSYRISLGHGISEHSLRRPCVGQRLLIWPLRMSYAFLKSVSESAVVRCSASRVTYMSIWRLLCWRRRRGLILRLSLPPKRHRHLWRHPDPRIPNRIALLLPDLPQPEDFPWCRLLLPPCKGKPGDRDCPGLLFNSMRAK